MSFITVPGHGPKPASLLFCGEAPGELEAHRGIPFVGPSGQELYTYCQRYGIHLQSTYRTNVVKDYIPGNPDPTPTLIDKWSAHLQLEVLQVQPTYIITLGKFAARWFLGDDIDLNLAHGLAHKSIQPCVPEHCIIIPTYHPAYGLRRARIKEIISEDFRLIADRVKRNDTSLPVDSLAGYEQYLDVTGSELADVIDLHGGSLFKPITRFALDTEGRPGREWSIQVCFEPGTAYVLRVTQPDFALGISALQTLVNLGCQVIMHTASTPEPRGCMYDVTMCLGMGLDLRRANLADTMYNAYLLNTSRSLKVLAYRHCSMHMEDYMGLVKGAATAKQLDYLHKVADIAWSKPGSVVEKKNDGTVKVSKPWSLDRLVKGTLRDYDKFVNKGEVDNEEATEDETDDVDDTETTKVFKFADRWAKTLSARKRLPKPEQDLLTSFGHFPEPTLDDIPLARAIYYAGRDADATLRILDQQEKDFDAFATRYCGIGGLRVLSPSALDLHTLAKDGHSLLPMWFDIQSRGINASRPYFESLSAEFQDTMDSLQHDISLLHNAGEPINPGSDPQVARLITKLGIKSQAKTKGGKVSVSKKNIEYLAEKYPAIRLIFDWREVEHLQSGFCKPVLNLIPESVEYGRVMGNVNPLGTHTRRLSMSKPINLLNIPTRTEIGRRIRAGYHAAEGMILGSWDHSQIETRVMAHESNDQRLIDIFLNNRDIHVETASLLFGKPHSEVGKGTFERDMSKQVNYGIPYGMSGHRLSIELRSLGINWSEDRCDELINEWYKIYKGFAEYRVRLTSDVERTWCVWDMWGKVRYLPNIVSKKQSERFEAQREAVAHRISGGSQGLIQNAMRKLKPDIWQLQDMGLPVWWLLQIHDEVVLEMAESLWEYVDGLVLDALTNHCGVKLKVPIEAGSAKSRTWGGLK